jgi:hypothetical protein
VGVRRHERCTIYLSLVRSVIWRGSKQERRCCLIRPIKLLQRSIDLPDAKADAEPLESISSGAVICAAYTAVVKGSIDDEPCQNGCDVSEVHAASSVQPQALHVYTNACKESALTR